MKKQEQKTVIITGGSSGIGAELVKRYCQRGDRVVLLSRTNPLNHPNFIPCDLTDSTALNLASDTIAKTYGKVDLLILNAGVGISGATELLPQADVRRVLELDYFSAVFLTQKLLPQLSPRGKIVVISSACALFALPFRSVYCSAKAAVSMFAYALRMELSHTGIKVVCICPGDIKSNFTANRMKFSATNERYGNRVESARLIVDSRQHKRMSLSKSGKAIFNICNKKRGALYIVGAKYKLLNLCARLLPTSLYLSLTNRLFGGFF